MSLDKILKVIFQGSIISDILVAKPDQIQDHEALGTSVTWAVLITDCIPFSEILQAVIEGHDMHEYQVLAVMYPSMITAGDLLHELERLLVQVHKWPERHVGNGIFNFMQVWTLSRHLEKPSLSEMQCFPNVCINDCPPYSAARPFSLWSNNTLAPLCTMFSGGGKPWKLKVQHNIASMRSQEIVDLSQTLCNLEFKNYMRLTLQPAIQTLATWRDNPQVLLFLPFTEKVSSLWFITPQHSWVPLPNKLRAWVIKECLNKSLRYQQDAFRAFHIITQVGNQVYMTERTCWINVQWIGMS